MGIIFRLDPGVIDLNNYFVYVDEHKMNQVIRNLLSNAMKFTPKSGVVEIKLQWLHPKEREEKMAHLRKRASSNVDAIQDEAVTHESCVPSFLSHFKSEEKDSAKDTRPSTPVHEYMVDAQSYGTLLISIIDSGPGVTRVSLF